jgi:MFS family permease
VRLLLGAAEAGFFPGIILYLTRWFPRPHRARIIGGFMAAGPLATVIGGPGSALLLALDGTLGLHGWQWLFIIEAVPSVVLSFVVLRRLTERPEDAAWLTADERDWLVARMAQEAQASRRDGAPSLAAVLLDSRVVMLCVAYFALIGSNNGLGLFLPQIVQSFGMTPSKATLLAALPFAVGVFGTAFWGWRSDRRRERRRHAAFPLLVGGCAIATAALVDDPRVRIAALAVAGFGMFAAMPVFWAMATSFLSQGSAAGGIALINAIGNLGGFLGPSVMGRTRDATGDYSAGLLALAAISVAAMAVVLAIREEAQTPAPAGSGPALAERLTTSRAGAIA